MRAKNFLHSGSNSSPRPKPDWANFLDDFQRHWPTDRDIYVDFVRDGLVGNGAERMARL
jgi:hypothetical protein